MLRRKSADVIGEWLQQVGNRGAGGITATRDMMVAGLGIGIRTMYLRNVEWIMVSRFHALTVRTTTGWIVEGLSFPDHGLGQPRACLPVCELIPLPIE